MQAISLLFLCLTLNLLRLRSRLSDQMRYLKQCVEVSDRLRLDARLTQVGCVLDHFLEEVVKGDRFFFSSRHLNFVNLQCIT